MQTGNADAPAAGGNTVTARTARLVRFWRWARPIVFVIVVVTAVRSSLADWNDVPTGSMLPTIVPGDRIFVNKLAYDLKFPFTRWRLAEWSTPQHGDVVVFISPADERRLVKRVVAVAGDTIEMRNNRLFVNGEASAYEPGDLDAALGDNANARRRQLTETAPGAAAHEVILTDDAVTIRSFGPLDVPDGHCFVLGDNRDRSADSRFIGPIPYSRVLGKATGVVFSLDRERSYLPRTRRVLRGLD